MSIGLLQVVLHLTSSGVAPSPANQCHDNLPINVDDEDEAGNGDDSEPVEMMPTSDKGKRGRGSTSTNPKGKKPKTSTGHLFQDQMDKIVEMNERTTASCESIARRGRIHLVVPSRMSWLWSGIVVLFQP